MNYTMGQFEVKQSHVLEPGRADVMTVSPWLAPIVWEGTFDPRIIDSMYKPLNITIATMVFAVGKYIQLLQPYLESAEKHYMVGHRMHYYVFTDQRDKVPQVALAPGRFLTVLPIPSFSRWQEICLRRMEFMRKAIEDHNIRQNAHFIFSTDIDMVFENRFGAEALGDLVATVHPWFYYLQRHQFTYERRKASQAYVSPNEGDFYYAGAFFGGRADMMHRLTKVCEEGVNIDKSNNIEAVWQEESHLNLYFIQNKPTKLLSPEYVWDKTKIPPPTHIRLVRFATIIKSYANLRPN